MNLERAIEQGQKLCIEKSNTIIKQASAQLYIQPQVGGLIVQNSYSKGKQIHTTEEDFQVEFEM